MWRYFQPVEAVFGKGERKNIGRYMEERGLSRGFLLCGGSQIRSGAAEFLRQCAGGRIVAVSSDFEPNPTIQNVDANLPLAREAQVDCVIAMGGGSAIDCAKGIAAALGDGVDGNALLNGHVIRHSLPLIAVPTTSGSGSDFTCASSLGDSETGIRRGIAGPQVYALLSIIDPELTYTAPPYVTAASGFDALTHCLDALISDNTNPYIATMAVKGARLFFENIESAVKNPDDHDARDRMSLACFHASMALSQVRLPTATHACGAAVTKLFRVTHGDACAFTADEWMREAARLEPERMNGYAREIGFADMPAMADEIERLKGECGLKIRLADFGATESDIPALVRAQNPMFMKFCRVRIGDEGMERIYRSKL